MTRQDIVNCLCEQTKLLADWNKANIDKNPEQVRSNIQTILSVWENTYSIIPD